MGAGWIVLGMGLIAFSDNFVALLADEIGLWQFQAMRGALILPLALAAAWMVGRAPALRVRAARRVAERTAFSVAAILCYFAALPAVGIAEAAAGFFTSGVWIVLIQALVFGERIGARRWIGVGVGFIGVCLVLGVIDRAPHPLGMLAVAGGAMNALAVIWTRRHCQGESPVALAVWLFAGLTLAGLAGGVAMTVVGPMLAEWLPRDGGGAFVARGWVWPSAAAVWITLGVGVAAFVSAACLARGYQSGPPSLMGLCDFSFLLWAPVFAFALRGEQVEVMTAAGMALIALAGALALWPAPRRGAESHA